MARIMPRRIWGEIERWMDSPEIIVIKGPRQAGKTTTLFHLQRKFGGVYLTLEDDDVREGIERDPKGFIQRYLSPRKKAIIYLDEAQYLRNIGHILKMWYDLYRKRLKLVVSGSGSFDVKVEVGRYLVGRLVYFELSPLDFEEFLSWRYPSLYKSWKNEHNKVLALLKGSHVRIGEFAFSREAERALGEFLIYGGFPRIVLEQDYKKKETLLKNLYRTYIEKDVSHFMGIRNLEKFTSLVKILASDLGQGINVSSLSSLSETTQTTLKEYLHILERTYILRRIPPFSTNKRKTIIKRSRVYFVDLGLRNAVIDDFSGVWDRVDLGNILENFVANELLPLKPRYFRTLSGSEIDFVIGNPPIPVEVKTRGKPERSFYSFIREFKSPAGVVFWARDLVRKNGIYLISIWMI